MPEPTKPRARRAKGTPGYLRHRDPDRGDRAFVILNGKRVYLGKWNSPESRAAYDRVVAEFLAHGRQLEAPAPAAVDTGPAVEQVIEAFWRHAKDYYRRDDGTPTGEITNIRYALRPLREVYGTSPAREFGPRALETVRSKMVDAGLCRTVVNQRVGIVCRMFRWAEAREMVPRGTSYTLSTLEPLKAGRSRAPEPEAIRSVAWKHVEVALPFMPAPVAAAVRLQWETAMRPGEVLSMRATDVEKVEPAVWLYWPAQHKNKHRGKVRAVPLNAASQEALRPFLESTETARDPGRFLFSPRGSRGRCARYSTTNYAQAIRRAIVAAHAEALQDAVLAAVLPQAPEQARDRMGRAVRRLRFNMEKRYLVAALRRVGARRGFDAEPLVAVAVAALQKAMDAVPFWSPNQLRHAAATRIERALNIEDARAVLGHASTKMTERYVDPDTRRAIEAIKKLG